MNHSILPTQGLRTTHTPAIFDRGASVAETRAIAGFAGSTPPNKAVHVRGHEDDRPSIRAALLVGARP
jgi:hypothetical protein